MFAVPMSRTYVGTLLCFPPGHGWRPRSSRSGGGCRGARRGSCSASRPGRAAPRSGPHHHHRAGKFLVRTRRAQRAAFGIETSRRVRLPADDGRAPRRGRGHRLRVVPQFDPCSRPQPSIPGMVPMCFCGSTRRHRHRILKQSSGGAWQQSCSSSRTMQGPPPEWSTGSRRSRGGAGDHRSSGRGRGCRSPASNPDGRARSTGRAGRGRRAGPAGPRTTWWCATTTRRAPDSSSRALRCAGRGPGRQRGGRVGGVSTSSAGAWSRRPRIVVGNGSSRASTWARWCPEPPRRVASLSTSRRGGPSSARRRPRHRGQGTRAGHWLGPTIFDGVSSSMTWRARKYSP